jgi:hypothetical protein
MKYDPVNVTLPFDRIDLDDLKGKPLGEVLRIFAAVREDRDTLRSAKAEAEKAFDFMARHVVPDALEDAGLVGEDGKGSASTPGGGKVYLQHDVQVQLAAGDRPEAYASLRELGYEELIQDYVFPAQLKSLVSSLMEEGEPLPAAVKAEPYVKAILRK